MAMDPPVVLQLAPQAGGQRQDAIPVALAGADEELVLRAVDVVDGQGQAFAQAQAAGVDELEGRAVTAQADGAQQIVHLLAREHAGQGVVILGADLAQDRPVSVAQEIDEELATGRLGLAGGFGLPLLFQLDEQEVVADLGLGELGRIDGEVFVHQAQLPVVGVAGAIGVVAQGQGLGVARHRLVGMLVIDGVDEIPRRGSDGGGRWWRRGYPVGFGRRGLLLGPDVLEVFGMKGIWIGAFHAPPSLYLPSMPPPGHSKPSASLPLRRAAALFNHPLDRMTRSAVSRVFQLGRHWRAPRHRSAFCSAAPCI